MKKFRLVKSLSFRPKSWEKGFVLEQEFHIPSWAVGDYCISLKVLKKPHKEIYSFKLTMLWLSFSSSFSSAKYFHQYSMHTTTVA